jgi:cytochrome c-type biogenesis protein CcmE
MTRKRRRLLVVLVCAAGLGSAAALTLTAFSSTLQLFVPPSRIATEAPRNGRVFRLGGLVEKGSVEHINESGRPGTRFRVTDGGASVSVEYIGILPDLFREGQGVVTLGSLRPDGSFAAQEVLAKHDETYMPPDVADALKKSGRWKPDQTEPPSSALWNAPDWNTQQKAGG